MLVTALTKRLAEDLSAYIQEAGIRGRYLHSEFQTLERVEIKHVVVDGVNQPVLCLQMATPHHVSRMQWRCLVEVA